MTNVAFMKLETESDNVNVEINKAPIAVFWKFEGYWNLGKIQPLVVSCSKPDALDLFAVI